MRNFDDIPDKKSTLLKIASILNKFNIAWGLGGSMLLYYYGIVDAVNDIDILIDIQDLDKFEAAIKGFSYEHESGNDVYSTAHLYSLIIDGVEIGFLVDFTVMKKNGEYVFPFGKELIEKIILLDGEKICLSSLIEWKKAYLAMNRESKYLLIEAYLKRSNHNS